jgi:hypothetical protein
MAQLNHGGYSLDVPDGIYQLRYTGGGHPGCGGYMEALEIEATTGPIFLLQEYRDDCHGVRWRWRKFEEGWEVIEAMDRAWSLSTTGEGFTPWSKEPFWQAVDYNGSHA